MDLTDLSAEDIERIQAHPSRQTLWHARVKLKRAERLIQDARDEFERFASNEPIRFEEVTMTSLEPPAQGFRVGYKQRDFDTPYMATAIVGDAIHNIRAALDVMACEFVAARGEDDKGVHFPFAATEEGLDGQIKNKKLYRAGAEAIRLLKRFEPYRGGNAVLRALHDADNEDKHSRLASTTYEVRHPGLRMGDAGNGRLTPVLIHRKGREIIGEMLFPEDSAFPRREVFPTLEELVKLVDGVVEAFAALLDTLNAKKVGSR